jgi:hypothetical protein
MLDYCLSEHHRMIKDLARTVAENKINRIPKNGMKKKNIQERQSRH